MSSFLTADAEPFVSFERGIDRESSRTNIPRGGYDNAVNMLLSGDDSGKHPASMQLDAELDVSADWPAANAIWVEPFTYSTYDADAQTLEFSTHLLVEYDNGQVIRYDAPDTDAGETVGTVENVRRTDTSGERQVNSFPYGQWLVKVDGRNAPMKYGQHFLWNGQLESKPYLFPLGSRPISPLDGNIEGEDWTHQAGSGNGFRDDDIVPMGARLGTKSLRLKGNSNSLVNFVDADDVSVAVDFSAPPQPYGGSDFAGTDYLVFSVVGAVRQELTGNIRIRFHDKTAPTTKYFTFTQSMSGIDNTEWQTFAVLISSATNTGSAVWTNIGRVTIFNDDKTRTIYVDDLYFLYANAPPAAQVGCTHKNRVLLAGAPVGSTAGEPFLDTMVYSDAGAPDEFPTANSDPFSGTVTGQARTSQINVLREYNDSVIVGLPNAIKAWTIGDSGNPVKSTVSSEHGIDSQRGVVETPSGSLIFPWQRGWYILRATGRQFISPKIAPFVAAMDVDDPTWTVGVADEPTKTIRLCWRENTGGTRTSAGMVYDTTRSQASGEPVYPSTMTQVFDYATPAYVNGVRETLYVRHNSAQVWRMGATTGTLTSSVTLPWMSRGETKDRLTKWMGVLVPYSATAAVSVYVRYAQHPQQFDSASFELRQTLDSGPTAEDVARAMFGGTSKWCQVKFEATSTGFEIFPPVTMVETPTTRPNA